MAFFQVESLHFSLFTSNLLKVLANHFSLHSVRSILMLFLVVLLSKPLLFPLASKNKNKQTHKLICKYIFCRRARCNGDDMDASSRGEVARASC